MGRPFEDLTGMEFGRLTVTRYAGKNHRGRSLWTCYCDCGNIVDVVAYSLKNGDTTSCGCGRVEKQLARFVEGRQSMIGQTFSRLVVDSVSHITNDNSTFYNCTCECGNKITTRGSYLKSGHTKSCGCYALDRLDERNTALRDKMFNTRFGRLFVRGLSHICPDRGSYYSCECDCGTIKTISGAQLSVGNTNSCGCLQKEEMSNRSTTHGLSNHRLYKTWAGMIQRCTNETGNDYSYYGNKGVRVCDEWRNDFMVFYNWAIQNGYDDNLTIERKDPWGNYEPNNCEWIEFKFQGRNKRNTKINMDHAERIRDDPRPQVQIAEDYGVSQPTISSIKLNKIWKKDL